MTGPQNVAQKLISSHLVNGSMKPGSEIGLKIDQTLTQDATGTLVMLELEGLNLDRVKTEISVQYVDHNLLQTDYKNPDDHLFLESACRRFGLWFSRPGNGVSHPVHMERFGRPGKTLVGSDSHTPAAGSMGMLAFGAGGLDVALAMAGEPLYLKMPRIMGVKLIGKLPPWVSAKDIILELLRRHDVDGAVNKILEFYGPGLDHLTAMDRHVIANMGTELGASTTVFPSDQAIKTFLESQQRPDDWIELVADEGATYDIDEVIDLSQLEPLIACPSSPGNVVPVREVEGRPIYQAVIGSSANPGIRDFWITGEIVTNRTVPPQVSFDINPTSRQVMQTLAHMGSYLKLLDSGARFHQAGCNGCIGMGQAPATGQISVRTMPRNFPGRSGTKGDKVYLSSPETAAASALTGEITDPRRLEDLYSMSYPEYTPPSEVKIYDRLLVPPLPEEEAREVELNKGPNIKSLPEMKPISNRKEVPVLLKMEDNISTDEILRAGAEVLPFRSNIQKISEWSYHIIDDTFHSRAVEAQDQYGGHIVVAGKNYAQGSSREHAALAPRYLGQIAVLAKSYARIGWQNLINFGILPLEFQRDEDYESIQPGDLLELIDVTDTLSREGEVIKVKNTTRDTTYELAYNLSQRQKEVILAGGMIPYYAR